MNEYDITTRIADEGRVPLEPLITPQEVTIGGPLFEDENLQVSAALVDHPPVVPALAYRFDGPDRSIVVSGDTRPSNNLIELAQGADVLVHEVLYDSAAVDRLIAGLPNAGRLKESIMAHHTTAEDVGRVAQAAGVSTLVLSHLVPAEDPTITDEMWIAATRRSFDGHIIVGHDLLVI